MADVKWIKICTDIFDDEKMCLIESMPEADGIIVIWFKLLCMAGKQNNSGVFMLNDKIAYTDEMLATIFRRSVNTVRLALEIFERYGMVEIIEGAITIPNWEKHQSLDRLEAAREKTRKRVAAHREKQKQIAVCNGYSNVTVTPCNGYSNVTVTPCNGYSNVTVTPCNALDKNREYKDIEEDKENKINNNNKIIYKEKEKEMSKEKDKESLPKKSALRFTPPSLQEVKAYCKERNNNVDAHKFVDFYESKGWMVGKNKMKDWKAAVRTWERSGDDHGYIERDPSEISVNNFFDMPDDY